MVRCNISVEERNNYTFEGESVLELFNSIKYSRATYRMTRSLGTYWMRKLFWPTFKNSGSDMRPYYIDISAPYPFNSILSEKIYGDFSLRMSIVTDRSQFMSTVSTKLNSKHTVVDAETVLNDEKIVSNSIRASIGLLSSYNVYVEKIDIRVNELDGKNLLIKMQGSIPETVNHI